MENTKEPSRNKRASETIMCLCLDFIAGDIAEAHFVKTLERYSKAVVEEYKRVTETP